MTYISHHVPIQAYEFCEFAIGFVDFPCAAPETRWHAHRRKYSVIVKQEKFKSLFNIQQILCDAIIRARHAHGRWCKPNLVEIVQQPRKRGKNSILSSVEDSTHSKFRSKH
jgi:hypothetical protein